MHTEEEAKTKWCPFTRITSGEGEWHSNRPAYAEVHEKNFDRCIGSACMAWRVHGEDKQAAKAADDKFKLTGERMLVPVLGFCGLAGRPS